MTGQFRSAPPKNSGSQQAEPVLTGQEVSLDALQRAMDAPVEMPALEAEQQRRDVARFSQHVPVATTRTSETLRAIRALSEEEAWIVEKLVAELEQYPPHVRRAVMWLVS